MSLDSKVSFVAVIFPWRAFSRESIISEVAMLCRVTLVLVAKRSKMFHAVSYRSELNHAHRMLV